MKLDAVGMRRINGFGKIIQLLGKPMSLGFVNGNPTQNEVFLICVSCGTGVV